MMDLHDIEARIDREVERLGGAVGAGLALAKDPPPKGLRSGTMLHTLYILSVLECAETPKTERNHD